MPSDTPVEKIDVLVIGAGQAGLAASEHLSRAGVAHLLLERARIAERWRSARWDSLVANGPAWHDRFPSRAFEGDPEAFVGKEAVAEYLQAYAEQIGAPVRCGVEVTRVERLEGRAGFRVQTTRGVIEAEQVIAATGAFQSPVIPPLVPATPGLTQLHSSTYRAPEALPEGAVLVVGAGSSGVQIADELLASGRKVFLSVGPHDRPPRRYRGRDFVWWLGVLNKWDMDANPGSEHTTIAVSGARGGHTVDFRHLAARGMVLLGRAESHAGTTMRFAADLAQNIAAGDANYLALLDEADAYVRRNGLNLPEDPEARKIGADPACMTDPIRSLDLQAQGITTILWATGFASDYGWLPPGAVDASGKPRHQRGVCAEPGIYFLGLPWQTRRGSAFIWGVWHDAKFVADQIVKQRLYLAYTPPAPAAAPHSA